MNTHELLLLKIKEGRELAVGLKEEFYNPDDPKGITIAASAGALVIVIDRHVYKAVASEEYAVALLTVISDALEYRIMPLLKD